VTGLNWIPSPSLKEWSRGRLQNIRELILETTGETYEIERLQNLPLNDEFGRWILTDGERDQGILWVMRLSNQCARVLAFSVANELQGNGIGARGWQKFAIAAKALGIRTVQLEVRQDNVVAISMYHRRGLRPKGRIVGFYRGHDGWLMRGPLLSEAASQ
jgi:ribosomal protein S18 acetylase RimI-like enzyme